MIYSTIDTDAAVALFNDFMSSASRFRILGLFGDAKMGKTHLLNRVFPALVQQNCQPRLAILDLRCQYHGVSGIIDLACNQLGDQYFNDEDNPNDYSKFNHRKVEVKGISAIFSKINIATQDGIDNARDKDRYYTNYFVRTMRSLNDRPILLLIDHVDKANEQIRRWLMEELLAKLAPLNHVRVVLAGRFLPEAYSSYDHLCIGYRLLPVTQIEAYITYCRSIGPVLDEQVIRTLAHAFNYVPGLFVEVLPRFNDPRLFNG